MAQRLSVGWPILLIVSTSHHNFGNCYAEIHLALRYCPAMFRYRTNGGCSATTTSDCWVNLNKRDQSSIDFSHPVLPNACAIDILTNEDRSAYWEYGFKNCFREPQGIDFTCVWLVWLIFSQTTVSKKPTVQSRLTHPSILFSFSAFALITFSKTGWRRA